MSERRDYGRAPRLSRVLLPLVVLVLTVWLIVVATGRASTPSPASPASPGGFRVVVNDQWLYFDEYVAATGTITITGAPGAVTMRKIPLGYALDVVWTGDNHAWIDAQVTKTEARP